MMVQKLETCKEMLNQRIYDLRIAEMFEQYKQLLCYKACKCLTLI